MKAILNTLAGFFLILFLPVAAAGQAQERPEVVPGKVLVKFRATPSVRSMIDGITPDVFSESMAFKGGNAIGLPSIDDVLKQFNVQQVRGLFPTGSQASARSAMKNGRLLDHADFLTLTELTFPPETDVFEVSRILSTDPDIVYAEPRFLYSSGVTYEDVFSRSVGRYDIPSSTESAGLRLEPDDPQFAEQWGFHNTGQTGGTMDADIDAVEAWNIQKGSRDVVVAIVDSGIDYTHPDLAANIWTNPGEIAGNGLDDDGNGYVDDIHGFDFFHGDGDPMDDNLHGTHVAGTVGAIGNNGLGVAGMSWQVSLMAVKFLGPTGSGGSGVEAVYYAANNGAHISNNSWGGPGGQALEDAIDYAHDIGQLFIAASGNAAVEDPHFPAFYENAFAVSSTDHQDLLSVFSNFGEWVDISAPGSAILSTFPGNSYGTIGGTSMATPHVSGLAALLKAEHPEWTADQIRAQIETTAESIESLNPEYLGKLGAGRINAHDALLPATPRLIAAAVRIDDDQRGNSMGNLDGVVNPGEHIELEVTLQNVGALASFGVSATLTPSSLHVTLDSGEASFGTLGFLGGSADNASPFLFRVAQNTPAGTILEFDLEAVDGDGQMWAFPIEVVVYERASLSGRVIDLVDETPLENARVRIEGVHSDFVLSDASGNFVLPNLLSGTYALWAEYPGRTPSDVIEVALPGESFVEIGLGKPELAISSDGISIPVLAWGESETMSSTISNSGTDSLSYDLFESLTLGADPGDVPSLRVGILRSSGNTNAAPFWNHISSNWSELGPFAVQIDYLSLNSGDITHDRLVANDFDVLIVAHAADAGLGWTFDTDEQHAIAQYVNEGHGIIVTGTLDSTEDPGQTRFFADLLGLESSLNYTLDDGVVRFDDWMGGSSITRRMETPYVPASQTRVRPEEAFWSESLVSAEAVGLGVLEEGLISTRDRSVFMSFLPEQSTSRSDYLLMYNALLYAGMDIPWLRLDQYGDDLVAGQARVHDMIADSRLLSAGAQTGAAVLVVSNDPDTPLQEIPLQITTSEAAVLETEGISFDGDGKPASGETTGVSLVVGNQGTIAAAGVTALLETTTSLVTVVDGTAEVGAIDAGTTLTINNAFSLEIDSEVADGTIVTFTVIYSADGGLQWVDEMRIGLRRLSSITGLLKSATSGEAIADEPVFYVGPESGSVQSATDGTYQLALPDGDYTIWAGGATYAESSRRIFTVPPGHENEDFSLSQPRFSTSVSEVVALVSSTEAQDLTFEVSNSGDGTLQTYFDFVPAGLYSKLGELFPDMPDPVVVPGPEGVIDFGRIALLMGEPPLGANYIEALLEQHGVEFDVLSAEQLEEADLSVYRKIILFSNQRASEDYTPVLTALRAEFEAYVADGGILQMHMPFNVGPQDTMPGGLKGETAISLARGVFRNLDHPIYSEPNTVEEDDVQATDFAAFGWFTVVPAGADTLMAWEDTGAPISVELPLGNGRIFATFQGVAYYRELTENLLLYGLGRPDWVSAFSPLGAHIASGESVEINTTAVMTEYVPGTTARAALRIRSDDPSNPVSLVSFEATAADGPFIEVEDFVVDALGDGLAHAGETFELIVSIRNSGTTPLSEFVVDATSTHNDVTFTPSQVSSESIAPRQLVQISGLNATVEASAEDGTSVPVEFSISDDSGFVQALSASFEVHSDPLAPDAISDLELVEVYGTGAHVSLTPTGDDGTSGTLSSFDVRWNSTPLSEANFATSQVASNVNEPGPPGQDQILEISGLTSGQEVFLAVKACDDAGNCSPLSNVVTFTPEPALVVESISTSDVGNQDEVHQAGELVLFQLSAVNNSGNMFSGLQVEIDTRFDDYSYVATDMSGISSWFVGDMGPGPFDASASVMLPSDAPVGHVAVFPVSLTDSRGLALYRDTIEVQIEGPDTFAPTVADGRFLSRRHVLGEDVTIRVNLREPGPIGLAEAVIRDSGGEEVARVPLRDDGLGLDATSNDAWFTGKWQIDRFGLFESRIYAEDSKGNGSLSEPGLFQGFSSEDSVSPASVLLVYDAPDYRDLGYLLSVESALETAGIPFNTWNVFYDGRVLTEDVLEDHRSGTLIYIAPQGQFTSLGAYSGGDQEALLTTFMDRGGNVLIAAQGVSGVLSPEFLEDYFGIRHAGDAGGSVDITGIANDVVGDGIAIVLNEEASAQNQFSQTMIESTSESAFPIMTYASDGRLAGARFDGGNHRSVFLGFGLEAVATEVAADVLQASWFWMQGDPSDNIPPRGTTDLFAEVVNTSIKLTWTAPGDDGEIGRAVSYDLRWDTIAPGSQWNSWWSAANRIYSLDRPLPAGGQEAYDVENYDPELNYYFLMRTEDDGRNLSPWSNLMLAADGYSVSIEQDTSVLPEDFELFPNYPNPFNPATTVSFALPKASNAMLEVIDVLGRRVAILVDGEFAAGVHNVSFLADGIASGVYFYRLTADTFVSTRTMTLVR